MRQRDFRFSGNVARWDNPSGAQKQKGPPGQRAFFSIGKSLYQ
jgi:hypothetical protein